MKEKHLGQPGTPKRDAFEMELRMDLLGAAIKDARTKRDLTQDQLGERMGVKKAQVSKLESSTRNATIGSILKALHALDAQINFSVRLKQMERAGKNKVVRKVEKANSKEQVQPLVGANQKKRVKVGV